MRLLQIITASILFLFIISAEKKHEYYVSVTKIEYSKEQESLQIISQIFIDDFETLMRKRFDETITLDTDEEPKIIETYMQRYLSDKLKISVNDEAANFKFIGKEYKDDITYCYLEIENVSEVKSIEVINRLLFDAIDEQQNIVRLKLFGKNRSFLLLPDNDKCVLNFD